MGPGSGPGSSGLRSSVKTSSAHRATVIAILKLITKHTVADSEAPDCQSKVRITSSPRLTKRSSIKWLLFTASPWCCCFNTTAVTETTPYANISTSWRRRGGVFEWAVLGGRGRILTLIKNISLVLRLSLCNFRDLIYAQSACNTPKRKENLKLHHMTPLKSIFSDIFLTSPSKG